MAKKSGEDYKIASIREKVEQEIIVLQAGKIEKDENLTVEQALIGIEESGIFSEIDLVEETGIADGYVIKLGYDMWENVIIEEIEKDGKTRLAITQEPKGYTNGNVTIKISVKGSNAKITNIEIPVGMTKKENGTYEVTKNGTYLVKAVLENGETLEKEIKINTIDKLSPKDFTITAQIKEGKLEIVAKAQDREETQESACSGIDRYEYYVDGIKYDAQPIDNPTEGEYKVYAIAYDKAENSTTSNEIEVKYVNIREISTKYGLSFVLSKSENLWGWGSNAYGGLGIGTTEKKYIKPTLIKQHSTYKQIAVGDSFALAIDENGNLWAWGYNNCGQLGDGTTEDRLKPVQIKAGEGENQISEFIQISVGENYTMALDRNRNLWAWGDNIGGQLGDGTTESRLKPVQIKAGEGQNEISRFTQISAGFYDHTIAIDENGNLWAWGSNYKGQLGDGTTEDRLKPVQIKAGEGQNEISKFSQISAGNKFNLAIDKNGNLWAWGYNNDGQLGDGTTEDRLKPVQIKIGEGTNEVSKFSQISAGNAFSLAIDEKGNLWGWGYNADGRVGDGTTENRLKPVQIKVREGLNEISRFIKISAGMNNAIAVDIDGRLWSWGNNSIGQVGNGTTENQLTPVPIF